MESAESQCLDTFDKEDKHESLRLLPKIKNPHTVGDRYGQTLLHYAAWNGWDGICRLLIDKYHCDPNVTNSYGQSPLHSACMKNRLSVIAFLLSATSLRLTDKNKYGRNPFDWLAKSYDTLSQLAHLVDWSTEFSVRPLFKIFMTGNTAAGKSSLTAVMQELASPALSQHGLVSGVKPLTAGVHTAKCAKCEKLGLTTGIEIYDLAGHPEYYSSNASILEAINLKSPATFVIMVDLTKSEERIAKEIYSWSNFLRNQSIIISSRIIVVGSRKDKFSSQAQLLTSKCKFVEDTAKDALQGQHFAGFVALDCRQLSSHNVKPFLKNLQKSIDELTASGVHNTMDFTSHLLLAFLQDKVTGKVISLENLKEQILLEKKLTPLSDATVLASSLEILTDKGFILFIHNSDCLSSSCIVTDKTKLLQEIHGVLFAPQSFREHHSIASNTGIVPVPLLQRVFLDYDSHILIAILTTLQFCHPIDRALLDIFVSNLPPESANSEQFLFFPALVSAERPDNLFISEGFGWSLYCTDSRRCLTVHFLHLLMLHVAYIFCLSHPTPPKLERWNEAILRRLSRSCTVWRNGIHWTTADGTQAIVQVGEECRCVSLAVSTNQQSPIKSIKLRSSLISMILSVRKELCSSVEVFEYLISPSQVGHMPCCDLSHLTVFDMKEVARAMFFRDPFILDINRKEKISPESLLLSDPYQVLPPTIVQQLFDTKKSSQTVPARMLREICDQCGEIPVPDNPTHQSLRELLNSFSVFAGRNPLELAGVTPADLPLLSPPSTPDYAPPNNASPILAGGSVHIEHYHEVHNITKETVFQGPVGGYAAAGGRIGAVTVANNQAPPTHQSARMTDNFGHCETDSDAPLPTLLPEATDSLPENALDSSHLLEVGLSLRGFEHWQELGLALGLDYLSLDSIDEKKGGDVEKCKRAMLHSWLQTGSATKRSLVSALRRLGEPAFAANIN